SPESSVVMFFLLLHFLLLLRLLSLAVFYHFGVSTFYTNFKFRRKMVEINVSHCSPTPVAGPSSAANTDLLDKERQTFSAGMR
ncbi:hypothetical protein, partial [Alkalicoccus saliphilus]